MGVSTFVTPSMQASSLLRRFLKCRGRCGELFVGVREQPRLASYLVNNPFKTTGVAGISISKLKDSTNGAHHARGELHDRIARQEKLDGSKSRNRFLYSG